MSETESNYGSLTRRGQCPSIWAGMKMRRSRQRKRIIGSRQIGVWNGGASSGVNYEAFTIPTPRGYLSKGVTGNNTDTSLTGRKRPASDAEHVQESTSFGTLLQHVVVERGDSDDASACQHSLDEDVGSARPSQPASSSGVKQIVVRLSGLRQSPATTSGEPFPVSYDESGKDMGAEVEFQQEAFRAMWNNTIGCSENGQDENPSCLDSHPSSQNNTATPSVRILHQGLQIPGDTGSKDEFAEAQRDDRPGLARGDDSGGSMRNLPSIDESCCLLESNNGQERSGFGHDLPARNTGSFPRPANPNWIYPATLSMDNQVVNGCHACAATRFSAPCTFQRGVPRAVRYYVEPAPFSQMKPYPSRIGPPACCQRLNFEGANPQTVYSQTIEHGVDGGRNLVMSSGAGEGYTRGTQYTSGDNVLVCPAPWIHEGRIFPGTPAMTMVHQPKYGTGGLNWSPENQSEGQLRDDSNMEESYCHEIPDPVYPPAHCNNYIYSYSADLDMDRQRHLEEQIAREILLLSQKLANLQARYGARCPVHNSTKPVVLSCPQTPLLLDSSVLGSQRDARINPLAPITSQSMSEDTTQPRPVASSSSRVTRRHQPDSRIQLEERKIGGRNSGFSSTPAHSSSRGSGSGASTVAFNVNKNHPHLRAVSGVHTPGNSTTGSRGSTHHSGCHHGANESTQEQGREKVPRENVEPGKTSNKSRSYVNPYRKGRERRTEEHVEECFYSDDMKEHLRIGGANVQGYPNGSNRFDWVKTLRFGGAVAHYNQGCADITSQGQRESSSSQKEFTEVDAENWLRDSGDHERSAAGTKTSVSVSKSVQAGGGSPEERVWTPTDLDDRNDSRPKRRPDSSNENRPGKSGKRTASPEEVCGLDSRITHHLLKAGLRRKPSLWKTPGTRPVSNTLRLKKKTFGSRSPRKDGGKRLRRRTLFDLNQKTTPANIPLEEIGDKNTESESQSWQLKEELKRDSGDTVDAQWQSEVQDYEAEYETFVENTDVGLHDNLDSEEYSPIVNREAPTRSSSHSHSTEEDEHKRSPCNIFTQGKARLSEAPVVCLSKPSQPVKKTFIRCIELVVATKKKSQLSKINVRKASGAGYSYKRVDCSERSSKDVYGVEEEYHSRAHVNEGAACQDTQVAEEQSVREPVEPSMHCSWNTPDSKELDAPSAMTPEEAQEMKYLFEDSLLQSMAQGEADNIAFEEHLKQMHNLAFITKECNAHGDNAGPSTDVNCSSVLDQVSTLASVLSRVMPKQMESMDAEQLRARWEELIDALEKERLGLPKIKTCGRKTGVMTRTNSPRDSGCVKRIAEQMKSTLRATKLDNLDKEGKIHKYKDVALEDATITKERPHWNKVEQKQAVVF